MALRGGVYTFDRASCLYDQDPRATATDKEHRTPEPPHRLLSARLTIMSDLFDTHTIITQTACNKYAEEVVGGTVHALDWQGYYSYTVESGDGRTIVQFRSDQSPLDEVIVKLARRIHPELVPVMECLGFLGESTVSVWKMDKIPGVGFLEMIHDDDIKTKLLTTVVDMAK